MTDISFYHLTRQGIEFALPKLLERVVASGMKAVVKVRDEKRLDTLNQALWTYDPASFLPHGTAKTGFPDLQPVYLTLEDENPGQAGVLVLTEGAESPAVSDYQRCLFMFDGRSDQAVAHAREQWKTYRDAGHAITYWQQSDQGKWEKRA